MPTASLCLIGRCATTHMGITTHDLVKTTKRLVGANGGHIKLDGVVFLNLTLRDATTSEVTSLFLSQDAC